MFVSGQREQDIAAGLKAPNRLPGATSNRADRAGIVPTEVREAHATPSFEAAASGGSKRDVRIPIAGEHRRVVSGRAGEHRRNREDREASTRAKGERSGEAMHVRGLRDHDVCVSNDRPKWRMCSVHAPRQHLESLET